MKPDTMLLGQRARQRRATDIAALDEHLPQQASASPLLGEGLIQLGGRQKAPFDQERPERSPRKVRVIHCLLVSACVAFG